MKRDHIDQKGQPASPRVYRGRSALRIHGRLCKGRSVCNLRLCALRDLLRVGQVMGGPLKHKMPPAL